MGLRPWELYEYTVDEFSAALRGKYDAHRRFLQELWNHERISCYYTWLASPNLPKNYRSKTIDDIVPNIYVKPRDEKELSDWYKNQKARLIKLGIESASRN